MKIRRTLLVNKLDDLSAERTKLEGKLYLLVAEQENIKERLNEFESPIAKLTVGFDDLMIIFPVALMGGFVVCVSVLVETISYRREYIKFHPKKKENRLPVGDTEDARSAPLWIDPKNPAHNKITRGLVMLLPFAIYLTSVSLILFGEKN